MSATETAGCKGDLLAQLRARGRPRPDIDEALVAWLRRVLEEAAEGAATLPFGRTLYLSKAAVRDLLSCEQRFVAGHGKQREATAEMVTGRMLDRVFAQVVMGVPVGSDPVAEALQAAEADGASDLAAEWEALGPDGQDHVRYWLPVLSAELLSCWPPLPPSAHPRLEERLVVELAGGRVVLSGRVDLALGRPSGDKVGTTLVDVKSGAIRPEDREDARFYALLETLRQGAQALQTGNFYVRQGALVLEAVTDDLLLAQAEAVGEAVRRAVALGGGRRPAATPSEACRWCPALDACGPGRRHERSRDPAPRRRRRAP